MLVVVVVVMALIFDFTNGMHDSANSIATVVSTRVLSPRQAVLWAAFFNFIAFLAFGTAVAETVGKGLINVSLVTPTGYAGAAVASAGFQAIIPSGWYKTLLFIVLAPSIGLFLGWIFKIVTTWLIFKRSLSAINIWSRRLQLVSAAFYSLGHGGNDAQKTMGIITSLLFSAGYLKTFHIPFWVVLSANGAIALGTLSGGWRIVKTMGQKITKLKPIDGVCAETASAISIFAATHLGVPVSTTHVITGAISGVGSVHRLSAVRWGVTLRIVWAWILTIPAAATLAALTFMALQLFL